MVYSSFDEFVNRILKESLIGGNISSTSYSPAKPQFQKQVKKINNNVEEVESNQTPPPSQTKNTKNNGNDQSSNEIKNLIAQMKEDEKKGEEFQKKLIATLTAQQKAPISTTATQQPSTQTNIPTSGNIDIKQILAGLVNK